MFFKNFASRIFNYFTQNENPPKGYKFNEIEQSLKELANNQENLEEILDFIIKSNFMEGDKESISRTIEYLQNVFNINEQSTQEQLNQVKPYKKHNKIDKSNESLQIMKDIQQKNDSIFYIILFLENKLDQLEINKSISNIHLYYLSNEDFNENDSNFSDNETPNLLTEIQNQNDHYFKCIFESITNSDFDPNEEKNINDSIDNLILNLEENEQKSHQMSQKLLHQNHKNDKTQANNYLQAEQILFFYSQKIIQIISMLQKKLTIIQITKSVTQLPIDVPLLDEFPNIQSDESELQDFFDKINNEIVTAKINSKSIQSLSNSCDQLKIAVEVNEQRIQKEQKKSKNCKKNKMDQFEKNHITLKEIFSNCNEKIKEILESIELQLNYTQQRKNSSKMNKKISMKNIECEEQIEEEIDEFNDLKDKVDQFGDMLNSFNYE